MIEIYTYLKGGENMENIKDYLISKQEWNDFFGDRDIITKDEWYEYLKLKNQ